MLGFRVNVFMSLNWHFCFLSFTSSMSLANSYTEDEPLISALLGIDLFLSPCTFCLQIILFILFLLFINKKLVNG